MVCYNAAARARNEWVILFILLLFRKVINLKSDKFNHLIL